MPITNFAVRPTLPTLPSRWFTLVAPSIHPKHPGLRHKVKVLSCWYGNASNSAFSVHVHSSCRPRLRGVQCAWREHTFSQRNSGTLRELRFSPREQDAGIYHGRNRRTRCELPFGRSSFFVRINKRKGLRLSLLLSTLISVPHWPGDRTDPKDVTGLLSKGGVHISYV